MGTKKVDPLAHEGFPLAGFFRAIAEDRKAHAEELLAVAIQDVRDMLEGKPRSNTFKKDTDPVDLIVQGAAQVELGRVLIQMDDEARAKQAQEADIDKHTPGGMQA